MSLTKSGAIQIGRSVVNSAIFNFNTFAGSGAMSLVRGRVENPVQNVMDIYADGMVTFANNTPVGRMVQFIGPYDLTGNSRTVGGIPLWTKRVTIIIVGAGSATAGNYGLIFYPQPSFTTSSVIAINGANGSGTSTINGGNLPLVRPTSANINAVIRADTVATGRFSISGEYATVGAARSGTCVGTVSCSGALTSIELATFGSNFTSGKISVLCEGW